MVNKAHNGNKKDEQTQIMTSKAGQPPTKLTDYDKSCAASGLIYMWSLGCLGWQLHRTREKETELTFRGFVLIISKHGPIINEYLPIINEYLPIISSTKTLVLLITYQLLPITFQSLQITLQL